MSRGYVDGTTHRESSHDGSVGALAVLPAWDGRPPLCASGGIDGRVGCGARHGNTSRRTASSSQENKREKNSANQDNGDDELSSGHDDWVTAAATVPMPDQEMLLATGARDGTIRIWEPQTRALVCAPRPVIQDGQRHQGMRTGGRRTVLVTSAKDGIIRFWDPIGGIPVEKPLDAAARNGCADFQTAG